MPNVTITPPYQEPIHFPVTLDHQLVTFGSDKACDVVIEETSISTHHAELVRVGGGYVLRDLQSLHGTLLNGKRMLVIDCEKDTSALLGSVKIDIHYSAEELDYLKNETFSSLAAADTSREKPKPTIQTPTLATNASSPTPVTTIPIPSKATRVKDAPEMSFVDFIIHMVLAAVLIVSGLAYRHYKETNGGNLIKDVANSIQQKK